MKLSKIVLSSLVALSAATVALPVVQHVTGEVTIVQAQEETVTLKRYYTAAHGDKAFTAVTVLLKGDVIVDAVIDEFQFTVAGKGFEGVPNSDSDFGGGYAEGQVLFSKLANNEAYSALMAEKAGSTVTYADNFAAIVASVKGKTLAEAKAVAEEVSALGDNGKVSDVVSGATLVDTGNYITAIVEAAEKGIEFAGVAAGTTKVELKQALVAPHGTRSFGLVSVAVEGDKVVGSVIDEFQFADAGAYEGVPNSEGEFAKGYAEGKILVSKIANNEAYSAAMAEKAGSTVAYLNSLTAITTFANGKTVEEINAGITEVEALGENGKVADVVSGATLADTAGYLHAIVDVASK
ncbi:MAG: peptidoglycan-binding protein [Aerococcaceae bacterium]|nr:peptidoglycan-binding protein [Aerococcaceae bacterium]